MSDVAMVAADVVRHTGCTYRQLDNWARTGIAPPMYGGTSSGDHRYWSRLDADAIAAITRVAACLRDVGVRGMPGPLARMVWDAVHADPTVTVLEVGCATFYLRRM